MGPSLQAPSVADMQSAAKTRLAPQAMRNQPRIPPHLHEVPTYAPPHLRIAQLLAKVSDAAPTLHRANNLQRTFHCWKSLFVYSLSSSFLLLLPVPEGDHKATWWSQRYA